MAAAAARTRSPAPVLTAAGLAGALSPPLLAIGAASTFVEGPIAIVGAVCLSAALNSLRPLGGGMVVAGTFRTRLGRREWTVDVDRDPDLAVRAVFLMALVTSGPFLLATPLPAFAWSIGAPWRTGLEELFALGGVAALLGTAALTHRRELPIWRLCAAVEEREARGLPPDADALARWTRQLAALARPGGGIGHVGGIGTLGVGLHEALDAERILRSAARVGVADAAGLHAGVLGFIARAAVPRQENAASHACGQDHGAPPVIDGGFALYPGGGGRLSQTARALEALGDRLPAEDLARHLAFVLSCSIETGGCARSPWGGSAASAEETARAAPLLAAAAPPAARALHARFLRDRYEELPSWLLDAALRALGGGPERLA